MVGKISLPFIRLGGRYQAARLQTNHGKPTNPRKAAQTIVFPTAFAPTVKAELGVEAVPMLGRAGQTWNPMVRSRR